MLPGFALRPKHLSFDRLRMMHQGGECHLTKYDPPLSTVFKAEAKGTTAATLILRRPAGASKDEGCGFGGTVRGRMLRGFALRSKHLSFDRLRMMHEGGVRPPLNYALKTAR
ncbi:hypothetical protein CPJ18_04015 [Agrobacterium rosae]|uniref:Uncharacterized protein n=1 Tax=Agrobacterium rosae TaxID=1972867 RepID=A0AAE5VR25_9HYPH|nr:hypothetical protein DXM21_08775 [Agrobacterium rosae]KAA3521428.1 hypothetical protein DXM25_09205 [Agrobacterium rosae]MQB48333.1 hypothetical protein [Agrobacterium rosae]POO53410.1 hypothetical protein CPJ18_04015 [Agrobacterium rosae]